MVCEFSDRCAATGERAGPAELQDRLTGGMIGLARATFGNEDVVSESIHRVVLEGLFFAADVNCDQDGIRRLIERVEEEKRKLIPLCYQCAAPCGRTSNYDMKALWEGEEDVRELKLRILSGIRGIAAHAYPAAVLGHRVDEICQFLYKALFAIGEEWGVDELRPVVEEADEVKRKCMVPSERLDTKR